MADDSGGGFLGGYNAQINTQQSQQLNAQALAKGSLDIQMTEMSLKASQAVAAQMADLNGKPTAKAGAGGQAGPPTPADQARQMSDMAFAAAQVYSKNGLVTQGMEFAEKASKLAENAATIDTKQAEASSKMWTHIGAAMDTVHSQQDWDRVRMEFPLMFPDEAKNQAVSKALQEPYDPKKVELYKRASMTAVQQADVKQKEASTKKEEASTKLEGLRDNLVAQQTREASNRADALGKAGVKPPPAAEVNNAKSLIEADYPDADPKGYQLAATEVAERARQLMSAGQPRDASYQQAYQEVKDRGTLERLPAKAQTAAQTKKAQGMIEQRDQVIDTINDMLGEMDETGHLTGLTGKLRGILEFGKTLSGFGSQETPEAEFRTNNKVLLATAPKVLGKSGKLAKDERELVAQIADMGRAGTDQKIGRAQLVKLRERLLKMQAGDQEKPATISGKGDKTGAPVPLDAYLKSQGY